MPRVRDAEKERMRATRRELYGYGARCGSQPDQLFSDN